MGKIKTCLWFDSEAEQAAEFYCTLFDDARVLDVTRKPDGSALVVDFELHGQRYMALNGGPDHKLTDAVSIYIDCESQDEVDRLWAQLTDGGEETACGWLKDRYGLSWQVVPSELPRLITDPDPDKAKRALDAMFTMKKIDIAKLKAAHAG